MSDSTVTQQVSEVSSPETNIILPEKEFLELHKKFTILHEDYSSFNRSLSRQRDLAKATSKKVEEFSLEAKAVISYIYSELRFVKVMNWLLFGCVVLQAVLILRMWNN